MTQPISHQAPVECAVVTLDRVSVWTPDRMPILDDLSWAVRRGQHWVVLGPNGAGKSTLLSLLSANRHPSSGAVTILGEAFGRTDMRLLRRRIALVDPAARTLDWLTAEEVVLTGIGSTLRPLWWTYSSADRARARELLALLGCADLADREISTCSQGERGRIRIARALIADPQLLLLDEPAVGLDLAAREALIAALDRLSEEKPDLTSVLVTHHLEEIPSSSTHAILLRDGQGLAVGAIETTLTSANLSACFGLPVDCRYEGDRWSARAPANWSRGTVHSS